MPLPPLPLNLFADYDVTKKEERCPPSLWVSGPVTQMSRVRRGAGQKGAARSGARRGAARRAGVHGAHNCQTQVSMQTFFSTISP